MTTTTSDSTATETEDRLAILELIGRLALLLDARDWDALEQFGELGNGRLLLARCDVDGRVDDRHSERLDRPHGRDDVLAKQGLIHRADGPELRWLVVDQHERCVLRGDQMVCERVTNRLARRSSRKVGFATARSCQPSPRSGGSPWLARCSAILAGQLPGPSPGRPSRFGSVVRERVGSRRRPGAVQVDDRRGRRPIPVPQAFQRLATAPPPVSARPVRRRRRTPGERLPGAHRVAHPLSRPGRRDRAGMTALAELKRIALAVVRLRVGAAAAAYADVPRLDGLRLLAGGVLSVYWALVSR